MILFHSYKSLIFLIYIDFGCYFLYNIHSCISFPFYRKHVINVGGHIPKYMSIIYINIICEWLENGYRIISKFSPFFWHLAFSMRPADSTKNTKRNNELVRLKQ